jgi:hypothetical protein
MAVKVEISYANTSVCCVFLYHISVRIPFVMLYVNLSLSRSLFALQLTICNTLQNKGTAHHDVICV